MSSNICCENIAEGNEKCEECPSGSTCCKDCPEIHRGQNPCKKCNCSNEEICDKKIGCVPDPQYIYWKSEICRREQRPESCCKNYRKVGEECEECWPGTYGEKCLDCPSKYYGRFCLKKCDCLGYCSPIHGCNLSMKEIYLKDSSEWKTGLAISGVIAILIVFGIAGACFYRRRRGGFWRKATKKAVSIDELAEQNDENDLRGLQSTRYNNQGNHTVSKDSEPSIQKLKKDDSESFTQRSDIKQNNDLVPVQPKEIGVEITSDFTLERNTYLEPKNIMSDEANNMAYEERQLHESYVILHHLENLDTCNNELGPYSNGLTNVDDSNTYLT